MFHKCEDHQTNIATMGTFGKGKMVKLQWLFLKLTITFFLGGFIIYFFQFNKNQLCIANNSFLF